MPIFQKSVIKKHLRGLNTVWLNTAYDKFKEIFSPKKISNILKLKEEEYQDGFLRDLFVEILGYTLKPDDNFNLVREFKNQTDGKKADGAIIKEEKAVAVIELKSTKTKDLTSITQQAFNYKNHQPGCKYVITSNFQKLRFYVDYANEYEEFDLFNLQKSDFELLYLILRKDSIFTDTPQKLKDETRFHEQNVSEQLYKDYSNFKTKIFENLVEKNTEIDKLTLFKKSQKLLDRLLFIFFAEDCGFLPANSISRIIDRYEQLKKLDAYKPLYEIYLQYFGYMNIGRKGQIPTDDIPAYNGGLFAPDKLLDNLKIEDKVLKADSLKLSAYDFNTDVDVNILGHIFEHSLNDIEEMEQNLSEKDSISKPKTSKRKKDGVFYTPKYITQYIIENTIGTLCTEKRKEMNIYEIEFDTTFKTKKGLNKKGKQLYEKLDNYKKWLKSLKILDPACGSGAFLNQALQFLMAEHKLIDDLISDLTGDAIGLFDTDKSILENNLYGVDINEESVEIAKLSLWLRTAQKGRALSNLSDNIKCGNSLINDQKIAKKKAFEWNNEFKKIIDNGGFDIIVGNPPYGAKLSNKTKKFLSEQYNHTGYSSETFAIFFELSNHLLKETGFLSFIVPSSIFTNVHYKKVRQFFIDKLNVIELIDLGSNVFKGVAADTAILILGKNKIKNDTVLCGFSVDKKEKFKIDFFNNFDDKLFNFYITQEQYNVAEKTYKQSTNLDEFVTFSRGVEFGFSSSNVFDNKVDDNYKPLICGGNITRYNLAFENKFVKFNDNNSSIYKTKEIYEDPKILLRRIGNKIISHYDDNKFYNVCDVYNIRNKSNIDLKVINLLLNSKLLSFVLNTKFKSSKKLFPKIPIKNLKLLPIKEISERDQYPFIEKVDFILSLNKDLQIEKDNFLKTLKEEKSIEKLSIKLQNFQNIEYEIFKKELRKKKVKINLGAENNEWREYFYTSKQKINELQSQINRTDNEIDKMVYKLYKLTDEEIRIIENEVKQQKIVTIN